MASLLRNALHTPSTRTLTAALLVAVLAFSLSATLARFAAPIHPIWVASARLAVSGMIWSLMRRPKTADFSLRQSSASIGLTFLSAALLAIHFGAWLASIQYTSILRATVITSCSPLAAGLLSWMMGEKPTWRFFAGAAVSVIGVATMAFSGTKSDAASADYWIGDLLAVVAAITVAGYLATGRVVRASRPLANYLSSINLMAAAGLALLAAPILGSGDVQRLSVTNVVAMIGLGALPGVVGHGVLNWAVRHAPVYIVSLSVILEPVGATLVAYLVLGEEIRPVEGVGAAILLLAVWIARASPVPKIATKTSAMMSQ